MLQTAPNSRVPEPDAFTESQRMAIDAASRAALEAIDGPLGMEKICLHQRLASESIVGPERLRQAEQDVFVALDSVTATLANLAWHPVFSTVATLDLGSQDHLWSTKRAGSLVKVAQKLKAEAREQCNTLRSARLHLIKAARIPRGGEGRSKETWRYIESVAEADLDEGLKLIVKCVTHFEA